MALIWIFAGGTGGHISPGVSLVDAFLEREYDVCFFTLKKDFYYPATQNLIKKRGAKTICYQAYPIPKRLSSLIQFMKAMIQSTLILCKEKKRKTPDAIICMGGYPCFPPLFWAITQKIPYYLCEQNIIFGKVTRLFSSRASAIFLSFPAIKAIIQKNQKKFVLVGNPIRKELLVKEENSANTHLQAPHIELKPSKEKKTKLANILLMGGSQGASDINELYLILKDHAFCKNIDFTVAAGKIHYEKIKDEARKQDSVVEFIQDIKQVLSKSNCIIARAGSGTIFEILSIRKPVILIPYPYATHNHQAENAQYIVKKGLGYMIDIRPFDVSTVAKKVISILAKGVAGVQAKMWRHDLPLNAHERVVDYIREKLAQ